MDRVGVRELKQNPRAVIERVEHGATVEITLQGRAVAMISPITHRKKWTSAAEVAIALKLAELGPDQTGWLQEHHESRDADPLVDPWDAQ
ncbi:type II toxin-antitoxin system Phd/YefM family antitoxin [Pseudarthrobacter albicanus]|uniref:type II toxin-antitoxin system Phd/YefM family antitoxin n=1 Tax=Pseudarthrobacter albicanus TaxID=2823873 RepID=UPI001BABFA79|nr:type II toxin-antitoxin system prevent-host-death family antitoxin [Pseudarthrobacter albicanus]